jgi:hypothetical protein
VPPLPTPAELYQSFGVVDDSQFLLDLIRIPLPGPGPLNTLASFTLPVGNIAYLRKNLTPGHLDRDRAAYVTGLTINAHDPTHADSQGLMQSCTAFLTGARVLDNAAFIAAVDGVGLPDPQGQTPVEVNGWEVDDLGRFKLMVYDAQALDDNNNALLVLKVLRCWVLFHEPTPPPPETPEQRSIRASAIFASQKLTAYHDYVTLPDADLWKASHELTTVARQLESAGWAADAVAARTLLVTALQSFRPSADQQLDYLIFLAEQRQNLIARLVEQGRFAEARALGPLAVANYRDYYTALPEAGRDVIVRVRLDPDLVELQRQLRDAGLSTEPVEAVQLLVEGFRASTPPTEPADLLDFTLKFAEALQDLIARLIDDHRASDAKALVGDALDEYRRYVNLPGSDRAHVVEDLSSLVQLLSQAQLTAEADAAKQAAQDLGP